MCLTEVPVIVPGNVSTPNYPFPYPSNEECLIVLGTIENQRVRLKFLDFDFQRSDICEHDGVAVSDVRDEMMQRCVSLTAWR